MTCTCFPSSELDLFVDQLADGVPATQDTMKFETPASALLSLEGFASVLKGFASVYPAGADCH